MDRYEALQHAVKAHAATLDKGGKLYVLHPMEVAERVQTNWHRIKGLKVPFDLLPGGISYESGVIVALLHDVIEDTAYQLDCDDFTPAQWEALYLVTHKPEDTYFEYIAKIAENQLATIVKLADLSHNLSPARQAALPVKMQRSLESRYFKARKILWEALGQEWWPA